MLRIVRLRSSGHLRLTFISWLLVLATTDLPSIDLDGAHSAVHNCTRLESKTRV